MHANARQLLCHCPHSADLVNAVKKSKEHKEATISTFRREVETLAQIRHVNLVELVGYSLTKYNDQIIVLEYMTGGTLYNRLHSDNAEPLQFKQRLAIALDAAEGINYLHKFTRNGIVHRDIKSCNILLDVNCVAKVSDFGLSRTTMMSDDLVGIRSRTTVHDLKVTHIVGTYGYMDPEWFTNDRVNRPAASTLSDVYAFGVVLFELITGKAALVKIGDEMITLVNAVRNSSNINGIQSIVDKSIGFNAELYNIVLQLFTLANKCSSNVAKYRPTMDDVSRELRDMYDTIKTCDDGNISTPTDLNVFQRLSAVFEPTIDTLLSVVDQQNLTSYTSSSRLIDTGPR